MATYHLHAKTHNRDAGKGAGGHLRYILRQGPYAVKVVEQVEGSVVTEQRVSRAEEVLHSESGHMPSWVQDPADYWDAADQYERKNGTVYREIEFALPQELPDVVNIVLARAFAERLAKVPGGSTPYTLAIHRSEKDASLFHCHLMLSDKINDQITRDPALWFKRVATSPGNKNAIDPTKGGAPKTQARIGQDWLGVVVRPLWAELANQELKQANYLSTHVDHRSLDAQRQEAEQQAEALLEQGRYAEYLEVLERVATLDRPPQPKKGRVLTHAGPEKAPGRAATWTLYEKEKQSRQAAAQAVMRVQVETITVKKALEQAEHLLACAHLRQAQRTPFEESVIRERWRNRQEERAKRLKRARIMERAQLRHWSRVDAGEIRERWSFRQQLRERRREEEQSFAAAQEAQAALEAQRLALETEAEQDIVRIQRERSEESVRPGYDRQRWLAWRKAVLEKRYDLDFAQRMIEERDIYCRWRADYGGLHLIGSRGGSGVGIVDTGPTLKIPPALLENARVPYTAADLALMVETAKAKGWKSVTVTGNPEFQFDFAKAAVQAGLHLEDQALEEQAYAEAMVLPNQEAEVVQQQEVKFAGSMPEPADIGKETPGTSKDHGLGD